MIRRGVIGALLILVTACGSNPPNVDTRRYEPLALVPAHMAGVTDRRALFRQLMCAEAVASADCQSALRSFRGEAAPTASPYLPHSERAEYRIAVALGMGWDCFRDLIDESTLPTTQLRQHGYDTTLIEVEGLSSSERNAEIIRNTLMADDDTRPWLLFGYSKGAADLLVALQTYPELARQTAALITVAGAVGGSPVAEHTSGTTLAALRYSPFGDCGGSDGTVLASLHPATRHGWLADHLPLSVPSYSLVTAPEPERVSRALRSSYRLLGSVHPLNDGALLHWDQVLPGASLLGYANADHWAVAVPISVDDIPLGDFLVSNGYPRTQLWLAMADFVIGDIEGHYADGQIKGTERIRYPGTATDTVKQP